MNLRTTVMGILNITPDSFYDGSQDLSVKAIQNKYKNIKDASIIDIGCESTRPGSFSIEASEEIRRLGLALPIIRKNKDKIFSIDTSKEDVAKFALENGFKIINDITAGRKSKNMLSLAADYNAKIILMHMLGTPDIMQENPRYTSVIDELDAFFEERIEKAIKANIKLENIIIDPGIGFGKTISDNDLILQNIGQFKKYNCPILIGVSRKSFLQHMEDEAINRLPATLGVTAIAINNGADIVRVHDVKQTISMLASVERIISV